MKTTELMIGDWVHVNPISHRVEPHDSRVLSIRKEYENGYIYIEGSYNNVNVNEKREFDPNWCGWTVSPRDLSPIPLTHEILEKNGFKTGKTNSLEPDYFIPGMPNPSFGLEKTKGFYFITGHAMMRLRYVHELQHALRLCGLDELANNFKV